MTNEQTPEMVGPEVATRHACVLVHSGVDVAHMHHLVSSETPAELPVQRGTTEHFVVSFDSNLGKAGPTLADAVLATCEADFTRLQAFFGTFRIGGLPFKVLIKLGSSGASHDGCTETHLNCDAFDKTDADLIRSLVVAEEDEVFMADQGLGWDCGASNGEALSRVLAAELYPNELSPPGIDDTFATAPSWLRSGRPNWVTKTESTDRNFVSIGCGTLFINWLRFQLGFSLTEIVQAGGSILAETYHTLTGRSDGWDQFIAIVNRIFPAGQDLGLTTDNPFPLGEKAEIVWYNTATGETQLWLMADRTIARRATVVDETGTPAFIGPPFGIVGVGDFNQDDHADILWYNSATGETQIWFMDGNQRTSRATVVDESGTPAVIGPPFSIVGVGDFNQDDNADIVWHNSGTGETQIWLMHGNTRAGRATVVDEHGTPALIGPPFRIVGVGDFNQDDHADILWYNSATGETQIWFMDGNRRTGRATVVDESGTPALIGPPFSIVGVGDFNQDKNADIVWYNSATGETQIWFMAGGTIARRATVVDAANGRPALIGPPFSIVGVGDTLVSRF
jgi:hypothetical protein